MMAVVLFGLIVLVWVGMGTVMIGMPGAWVAWIRATLGHPLPRYGLAQGMLLMGVVLFLGRGVLGTEWLWLTLGTITVVKALLLLGSSQHLRDQMVQWWEQRPLWLTQGAGVVMLGLAGVLALGTIRVVTGL